MIIMTSQRQPQTNLWQTELSIHNTQNQQGIPQTHNVYQTNMILELTQFLHAACGSLVPSTWIKAIDTRHFATWSGLTSANVKKYLPTEIATSKGHLNQQCQNIRSMQLKQMSHLSTNMTVSNDTTPLTENMTEDVYVDAIEATGKIFTDLTGHFPVTSSKGNKYIMLLYHYDTNVILVEPMSSCADTEQRISTQNTTIR